MKRSHQTTDSFPEGSFESLLSAFSSLFDPRLLRRIPPPRVGDPLTGESSSSVCIRLIAKSPPPLLSLFSACGKLLRDPVFWDLVEEDVEVESSELPKRLSSKNSSGQSRKKRTTLTGVTTSIFNSFPPGLRRLGPKTVERLLSDILFSSELLATLW